MTLTQAQAITRHLGLTHKGKNKECLYPGKKNPEHSYEIDLILEDHSDSLGDFYFMTTPECTPEKIDDAI